MNFLAIDTSRRRLTVAAVKGEKTVLSDADCPMQHSVRLMGEIVRHGCTLTGEIEKAQIVLVNTCAFLNAAREESINAVLEAASRKGNGVLEKVVVTGCLPEKFIGELYPALTEADVFLGVKDFSELFPALERSYRNERVNAVGCAGGGRGER